MFVLKGMRIGFIISFLILFFDNSYSQNLDSLEKKYNYENIVRFGSSFMKGGEKLSFTDLGKEFNPNSVGYDLYLSARRNKTNAAILSIGALASSVALLSFAASSGRNNNRAGMYISIGTQVIFTLFSSQSRRHYIEFTNRALIERNRQVLFR